MNNKLHILLIIFIFGVAAFLRLYQLTNVPPSLYWEEVAVGYDAYSLLKTGKDHHDAVWPIIAIKSFGDWKPTGYFYALLPSLALFGLSDFAVRLPNALAGVLIVIGVAVLARKLHLNGLWALAVAAISPWAIQFSRSMWEANFATSLLVWGVIGVFTAKHQWKLKRKTWILAAVGSALLFVAAGYTYHAARVIAPILCLSSVIFVYRDLVVRQFSATIKISGIILGTCFILYVPLFLKASSPELSHRFQETSIFGDAAIIEMSNALREQSDMTMFSRIIYHRYVLYSQVILENAVSHFSPTYMFLRGDENIRHSTHFAGLFYIFESVFLGLGFIYLWNKNKAASVFLLIWLLVTLFPAALTKAVPHALRTLPSMPVFILYITAGITSFLEIARKKKVANHAVVLLIFAYSISSLQYLRYYFLIYPKVSNDEWQYGYTQMISELNSLERELPEYPVYVSRIEGRPAMYYWFYSKTDPRRVQTASKTAMFDQGEFLTFENKSFYREIPQLSESSIIAAAPEEVSKFESLNPDYQFTPLKTVSNLSDTVVWQLLVAEEK